MNSKIHSKSSLFLMELIIAIFFFSLASAVCVRLFVGAHKLAEKSVNLNHAVNWTQNVAETFYSCNGNLNSIVDNFENSYSSDNKLILFFDGDWNMMAGASSEASYEVILITHRENASDVYSDVSDYSVKYDGEVIVGDITVIDIRAINEVVLDIQDDSDYVILSNTIDILAEREAPIE